MTSISDIQDYFEYIIKKMTDNPQIRICINKIEIRITGLNDLKPLKITNKITNSITNDKNGENVPHLEITEIILVHCNIVTNSYQRMF